MITERTCTYEYMLDPLLLLMLKYDRHCECVTNVAVEYSVSLRIKYEGGSSVGC